jgi:hypothetical protein
VGARVGGCFLILGWTSCKITETNNLKMELILLLQSDFFFLWGWESLPPRPPVSGEYTSYTIHALVCQGIYHLRLSAHGYFFPRPAISIQYTTTVKVVIVMIAQMRVNVFLSAINRVIIIVILSMFRIKKKKKKKKNNLARKKIKFHLPHPLQLYDRAWPLLWTHFFHCIREIYQSGTVLGGNTKSSN